MIHSEKTSRDDSTFENTMGIVAAVSVLCLMSALLFF